jgi:hypothetical protein
MRKLRHVGVLLRETVRYGITARRWSLVVLVALGLLLAGVVLVAQLVAPVAIYPFA